MLLCSHVMKALRWSEALEMRGASVTVHRFCHWPAAEAEHSHQLGQGRRREQWCPPLPWWTQASSPVAHPSLGASVPEAPLHLSAHLPWSHIPSSRTLPHWCLSPHGSGSLTWDPEQRILESRPVSEEGQGHWNLLVTQHITGSPFYLLLQPPEENSTMAQSNSETVSFLGTLFVRFKKYE